MSGRFGEYSIVGPAQVGRVRSAAVADYIAAAIVGIIIFPFPIVRAYVEAWVFVVSILVVIGIVHALYVGLTTVLLGRTPGMYLFDLGLCEGRPTPFRAALFGFASAVVFWPSLLLPRLADSREGIPARVSSVEIGATKR